VREICTPGSAWGDEIKRLCLLGEVSARKRSQARGSARATVVKTRLYHPIRGVGEVSIVPPPAAAANAIYRAVGVRMTTLPMSPPRVLKALLEKQSQQTLDTQAAAAD